MTPVVSVQNRYNLVDRESEDVLEYCTRENIGFIPWFRLATGNLAKPGSPLEQAAERLNAQPSQLAIAWLLRKSPVMLPIPGTSKVEHLEANTAAALLELSDSVVGELEQVQADEVTAADLRQTAADRQRIGLVPLRYLDRKRQRRSAAVRSPNRDWPECSSP